LLPFPSLSGGFPGAFIAISALQKYFADELTAFGWLPKLKEVIPSYGVLLIGDAKLLRSVRAETAKVLKVENIKFSAAVAGSRPPAQRRA
jgi:malate dehydrogenase (quinone)